MYIIILYLPDFPPFCVFQLKHVGPAFWAHSQNTLCSDFIVSEVWARWMNRAESRRVEQYTFVSKTWLPHHNTQNSTSGPLIKIDSWENSFHVLNFRIYLASIGDHIFYLFLGLEFATVWQCRWIWWTKRKWRCWHRADILVWDCVYKYNIQVEILRFIVVQIQYRFFVALKLSVKATQIVLFRKYKWYRPKRPEVQICFQQLKNWTG